jgi:PAS domain S-box-containing protein
MTITSHCDASQQVEYLICASRDVTERKHAEDELRTLVDALPQLVWIAGPDGSVTYHNQRLTNYTAMTLQQAEGDGWLAGVHPDDRQLVRAVWQTSVQTGMPYEVEHRLRDGTSGAYRWFLARAMPVRDETGQVVKWFGTRTDITDQKQTEQRLKESEERFRVLAETVPQLVWVAHPDGQHEYTNQHWCDYTGFTLEQLQSDRWTQLPFIHPDDREGIRARWQQARDTGAMYEHEGRLRNGQTGEYRWFLTRGTPMRDETGQISKWFGTCTDIEEQKRAEQRLKESEERFRVLAETVPQLVWTVLPDGSFEYANQRYRDWTQADFEISGDNFWRQFVHPEDIERTLMLRRRSLETGEPFETEYRLRNSQTGEYRWFLARSTLVRDEAGQIVKWFGTSTDIEEQKRTEEALRQSQEQVQTLMSSNILGIYMAEEEVIVEANETFLHMTGYSREDLQHGRLNRMEMTAPEYIAITKQAREQLALHAYVTPYEKEYLGKDGSRLPVVVGGVATQRNPQQEIIFVLDNSARKELEQRKDDFISMASHELRTPLTAVKIQVQLVRKRLKRQGLHEAATALLRVEGPVKRLERLTAELLDVSKMQADRLEYVQEPVDLDALLREITDTMQHIHPSHTMVVRGAVQTSLMADRDRLGQVFTNLISNAIKYSPDAETVEIDLSASPETVTIRVRDYGLGIPRELRDKIFERFYRAAGPKQRMIPGLGMGLYIVAEIVKRHGGTITVESAVGKGSTFTVTLPLTRFYQN